MKRGLVISDLHLFARRSEGDRLLEELRPELGQVDLLVLNGDTFDFNWSRFPTIGATLTAALEWLRGLIDAFAGREIHYVLGNHDCITAFRAALHDLTQENSAFHCHEHQLRLGRQLFLHGDCANHRMDHVGLRRLRDSWSREKTRSRAHATFYDVIDTLGISRGFHRCYFPMTTTVKRVAHYLDHVMPDWRGTVDDCYFGHTHQPFHSHHFDGVRFHNTGSAIRGMGFQPLHFELIPEQLEPQITPCQTATDI